MLELPFNEVLQSGEPDFPFCLGWANHSWSNKTWQKSKHFTKDVVFWNKHILVMKTIYFTLNLFFRH
ncbi:glycoside hydrolase family 99-like domain-containing protein [Enterococcus sp. 079]|nr:glycoside hydrolase family 99-like domain-containing protein [Enterococcus sp. 079]